VAETCCLPASDATPAGCAVARNPDPGRLQGQAWRDFCGLSGGIALVGLALGSLLPLSALRLEQGGHGSAVVGLLMAVHALGLMLALAVTAPVLRWVGAREVLITASAAAAGLAMALQAAHGPAWLAAGLFGLGLLLGLVFNLVETWVNALLPEAARGRWLAVHCTVFTLFQLCGPALLPLLPAPSAYLICGGLLLLALPMYRLLSARDLADSAEADDPEAGRPEAESADWPWWRLVAQSPATVWSTVLFALFDALVLSLLPLYARAQGQGESEALLSASVVLAGDTALEWAVGALADRHGRRRLQWVCALLLLAVAPLLPLAVGSWAWWPLLALMGGAAGGLYVLSLMASGQRYSGRGLLRITAVLGAAWGAASAVGPLLTGVAMAFSPIWALPVVLCSCTAVLLVALRLERPLTSLTSL